MSCELWALDPDAGEAILREGDRWYLSAMDSKWRPVELAAPEDVLEWSLVRRLVPVGRDYGTRDEVVIVARQVCRTAWSQGAASLEEIRRLLANVEGERERRRELALAGWESHFPEVIRAALELDRYFQAQGCTVDESLHWILRTLQSLRESGKKIPSGRALSLTLLELARNLYQEGHRPEEKREASPPLSDHERRRLARSLRGFSPEVLDILTLWADSSYSEGEIALLLQTAPGDVLRALEQVTKALGRSAERLRDPALAELCKDALRARP